MVVVIPGWEAKGGGDAEKKGGLDGILQIVFSQYIRRGGAALMTRQVGVVRENESLYPSIFMWVRKGMKILFA